MKQFKIRNRDKNYIIYANDMFSAVKKLADSISDEEVVSKWTKNNGKIESGIIRHGRGYTFYSAIVKEDKDFDSIDEAEQYAESLGYTKKQNVNDSIEIESFVKDSKQEYKINFRKYYTIGGYAGKYDPQGLADIKKAAKYGVSGHIEKTSDGYQLVLSGEKENLKNCIENYFGLDSRGIDDKSVFSPETMNSMQEGVEKDYESMNKRLSELKDSSLIRDKKFTKREIKKLVEPYDNTIYVEQEDYISGSSANEIAEIARKLGIPEKYTYDYDGYSLSVKEIVDCDTVNSSEIEDSKYIIQHKHNSNSTVGEDGLFHSGGISGAKKYANRSDAVEHANSLSSDWETLCDMVEVKDSDITDSVRYGITPLFKWKRGNKKPERIVESLEDAKREKYSLERADGIPYVLFETDSLKVVDKLIQSSSQEAFKKNIATEIRAGKDPKQAAAIAYSVQRENNDGNELVGKKVKIVGNHNRAGKTGTIASFENGYYNILFNNGNSAYVKEENIKVLDSERRP